MKKIRKVLEKELTVFPENRTSLQSPFRKVNSDCIKVIQIKYNQHGMENKLLIKHASSRYEINHKNF